MVRLVKCRLLVPQIGVLFSLVIVFIGCAAGPETTENSNTVLEEWRGSAPDLDGEDYRRLVRGVSRVEIEGTPGPLLVYGDHVVPLITGSRGHTLAAYYRFGGFRNHLVPTGRW